MALRQLLDAGTLSNLPAGFKQRGVRVRDEASPIQPGEFKDVDAPGGNLREAFLSIYHTKNHQLHLLQLNGYCGIKQVRDLQLYAEMQVGEGQSNAAVVATTDRSS